jgi:allantoinase
MKELESGDFMTAWGGVSSLGLGLSLLWTEGRRRGVSIGYVVRCVSTKNAELAGLSGTKGQLKVGYDGDLVIWDPEAEFKVNANAAAVHEDNQSGDRSRKSICISRTS